MKTFFIIFFGSFLGGVLYVSVGYNLYPRDTGSYLSYFDNLLISFVISLITSIVFLGFFRLFKVKDTTTIRLVVMSLVTQVIVYVSALTFLADLGTLGVAIAILVFSALANFLLDKWT